MINPDVNRAEANRLINVLASCRGMWMALTFDGDKFTVHSASEEIADELITHFILDSPHLQQKLINLIYELRK